MLNDAKRFRERAIDCRAVAKGTRNEEDAILLEEMAAELEAEAARLEKEHAAKLLGV